MTDRLLDGLMEDYRPSTLRSPAHKCGHYNNLIDPSAQTQGTFFTHDCYD
jgi:hypothetical protein